jgi:hypothetical protein
MAEYRDCRAARSTPEQAIDPPAWADPDTRAGWQRHRRGAVALLVIGLLLSVFTTANAAWVRRQDAALLADGHRTPGLVLDGESRGGRNLAQSSIDVRYVVDGVTFTGTLHGPDPGHLPEGSRITVIHDVDSPGRFRTASYANHSNPTDVAINGGCIVGNVLLLAGIVAVLRSRRWRCWLREGPWLDRRAVRGRSGSRVLGGTPVLLLRSDSAAEGEIVRFDQTWKSSLDGFAVPDDGIVRFRPGRRRRGLVSTSTGRPFQVRAPRSRRQREVWLGRIEDVRADYRAGSA